MFLGGMILTRCMPLVEFMYPVFNRVRSVRIVVAEDSGLFCCCAVRHVTPGLSNATELTAPARCLDTSVHAQKAIEYKEYSIPLEPQNAASTPPLPPTDRASHSLKLVPTNNPYKRK